MERGLSSSPLKEIGTKREYDSYLTAPIIELLLVNITSSLLEY